MVMKAKFVKQLSERYFDNKPKVDNAAKYENPVNAKTLQDPFGYYDMANSLSVKETVMSELSGIGIRFTYDGYNNFLVVLCTDEEEAYIVKDILENIAEGDRYDRETILWYLENEKTFSDSAYVGLI
jgi:hypothetical protein